MREHPLRSILGKLVRTADLSADAVVCYIHRGAHNNELRVRASVISKVGKGWFGLPDGETQIPFHRVIWVRDLTTGKSYWEKRYPKSVSSQDH